MAENIISNTVKNHDGASEVANWISQINAGNVTYDIATHHGITFKDGKNDSKGTTWNGLTDLEIVIPNITDIVQTPIEFAGTVSADETISWNDTHKDGPKEGYLVFVTANCTLGGLACEAGDMAIYGSGKWNIVSGENQVEIVASKQNKITDANRTTVAVGAAKDVLVVEGKALSLTLDYADLNDNHIEKEFGENQVGIDFDSITVDKEYIKLSQAAGQKVTVGENVDFDRATALKDGKVTFTGIDNLINGVTFGTFNAGAFPTLNFNSEKTFVVEGGSVNKIAGSDFVDGVNINPVTFVPADDTTANKITMLTGLTAGEGAEFFNGIHKTIEGETADFTIKGFAVPVNGVETTKFVEGIEGGLTPVTSITAGNFELTSGTALATGFSTAATGKAGDVLSDVVVTPVKGSNVLNSATVKDHVLSFGSVDVMSDVNVTYESKTLQKTGFKYTAPVATNTSFVTSGFTNVADVDYTFGRKKETTYTADDAMWALDTPALTVTKGAYRFVDDGMKATVPASTFAVGQTTGTLPTLSEGSTTKATVTGSVGTDLTFAKQTIHAVKTTEVTLPGAYEIVYGSEGDGVLVGKAGEVANKTATVDLSDYLMDVNVVTVKQA